MAPWSSCLISPPGHLQAKNGAQGMQMTGILSFASVNLHPCGNDIVMPVTSPCLVLGVDGKSLTLKGSFCGISPDWDQFYYLFVRFTSAQGVSQLKE